MDKILITIPFFGDSNYQYMVKQVKTLMSFTRYDLDIHIFFTNKDVISSFVENFTAEDNKDNVELTVNYRDESLGKMLPFECRKFMNDMISEGEGYDYYIFMENDLLLEEHTIDYYIQINNNLPDDYTTGFLRYEREGDVTTLTDLDGMHSVHRGGDGLQIIKNIYDLNGERYFEPWNLHSSSFIFDSVQMQQFYENKSLLDLRNKYYQEIETIGTNLYLNHITKVYPCNPQKLSAMLVHHMPNKYIYWRTSPTWNTLLNLLGER